MDLTPTLGFNVKKVTISDVAKHAGVSKSTVSQYLNGRYEYMSERTRKKIEFSIRELKYRPNIVARSLTKKTTYTIGIIVANILHYFSTQIIRNIEQLFNKYGFHTIVCNADDEPAKERQYIEMLMAKQVDGIIIFPTGDNLDLYQQMKKLHFPIVFMDRTIEGLKIPSIMLHNEKAAEMAVNVLVDNGHERIAMMTASIVHNITPRIERIEGYKKALLKNGLNVRDEYIQSVDIEQMKERLHTMFQLKERPEAIIAASDRVLIEVLNYAKEQQLNIPNDLAIVAIDDVPYASFFTPTLTTVSQPTLQMAEKAAELLLLQIKGEEKLPRERIIRFEGQLNERESHKKSKDLHHVFR